MEENKKQARDVGVRWTHVSCLRQVRSTPNWASLPTAAQNPTLYLFSGLSVFFSSSGSMGLKERKRDPLGLFFFVVIKKKKEKRERTNSK